MTLVRDDLAEVDVASPSVYAEGVPHETLGALREHDPVHWHPFPGTRGGFWLLTTHADVVAVGRDPGRSRRSSVTSRSRTGSPTRSPRGSR